MSTLKKIIERLSGHVHHPEQEFFRQYVGDDAILTGGAGELFLYLDGRDASLTPCLLRDRNWEPQIGRWLARNLQPGSCFVDVGGNIGFHSLTASKYLGSQGLVVAFEPQERLLRLFQRSISANGLMGQVHARRLAIGDREGRAKLGKFEHLTGSATLTGNELIVEHEDIEMLTLSAALARIEQEIRRPCQPDVIKIDVEGFEVEVWQGMKDWTSKRERLSILIEYSPVSYSDRGNDPLALLEDFGACGFAVLALEADGQTKALDRSEWARMAAGRRQYDLVLSKGG